MVLNGGFFAGGGLEGGARVGGRGLVLGLVLGD